MWYFTFKKENGILSFKDYGGYECRNPSTIWCIQQADKTYKWDDFDEITVHTDDFEHNQQALTYSKSNGDYSTIVPDFHFQYWPQVGIDDYDEVIDQIDREGRSKPEIDKVGWIGNTNTHPIRKKLHQIGQHHKDLMEIQDMTWIPGNDPMHLKYTNYLSLPDLVAKYSMLIDVEGRGYSGRLKYLLWSHRPVLLADRPHHEYFYEHLKPWEHYIPVKRDLSDLIEKVAWCKLNHGKAAEIAENAYQFSKVHLTRAACYTKWNDVVCRIQKKRVTIS